MASLYGTIEGHRGAASRTGTKNSGIKAQVQTYASAVLVTLQHNDEARVVIKHPATGRSVVVWEGNAAELLEKEGQ